MSASSGSDASGAGPEKKQNHPSATPPAPPAPPAPPSALGGLCHDAPTIPTGAAEESARFAGTAVAASDEAESFGAYKILRKLGEGGFGVVYACEQREPIRRQVALKVIKLGMDTREVIARFEAERQALAVMDHPNVAKVLDAGVTPRGRPYFVMEYVAGMPITDYCDQSQLAMRDRLVLFMMVCHAVQHAHQKGIIHRDLKPSNVLVTLVDGKPVPKVIDFGIAKATGQHLTERTMFTEAGRLIGTPEYMSPEQAGTSPLDVDTRTDVYALGVLLYELLTGMLPHEPKKLRSAAMTEIQRIIREVEPPKPSTRLGQLGVETGDGEGAGVGKAPSTAAQIAHRRRMEPSQLVRELRGDLDWITMKAMEKDRVRRYDTAAAFAGDIEHYLRNEPVTAGPPSATYRIRKFARRNRGAVATAAVFGVLVAGGVTALSAAYGQAEAQRARAVEAGERADRERGEAMEAMGRAETEAARADREMKAAVEAMRQAEQEKMRADAEAGKAMAAFEFLSGMFESIDPAKARGREVTVREILDAADEKMKGEKGSPPELEATVRELLATAYHRLAELDRAEENMRRALAIREKEHGADSAEALQDAHNLGATMAARGKFEEAEALLARATAGRRALHGEKNRDTLASKSLWGYAKQNLGDYTGAEEIMRQVAAAQSELLGPGDPDTIDSRLSILDIMDVLGRHAEAEAYAKDLIETATASLGADHPMTLQAMSMRGSILYYMGRYEESERVLRETLEVKTRVFGAGHKEVLLTQNILAMTLDELGREDEAEAVYRKIIEASIAKLGAEHPQTLATMNNLAQLLRRAKKFEEAERMYRDAMAIRRRISGDDHVETLTLEVNLGMLMRDTNKHEQALLQFEHALAGLGRTLGADHWMTAATIGFIGEELLSLGRDEEAEKKLIEAHGALTKAVGPAHARPRQVAGVLADHYKKLGKAEDEAAWRERAAAGVAEEKK